MRAARRRLVTALTGAVAFASAALTAAGGWIYFSTESRLNRIYRVDAREEIAGGGPNALRRGRHLVEVVGSCPPCHGDDLAGSVMADEWGLGRLDSTNLTPGRGGIADYSDADLVHSIRFGVRRDGRPLLMMPSQHFAHFSNADLGAIITYLRSLPPVDRRAAKRRIGPVTRLVLSLGAAPDLLPAEMMDGQRPVVDAPIPAATARYGAYLVTTAGCKVCHREDLRGGLHPLSLPGEPPPPDLTPDGTMKNWSEANFMQTLKSGVTPDGRELDEAFMPWRRIARMNDSELRAIWLHLRSLPSRGSSL